MPRPPSISPHGLVCLLTLTLGPLGCRAPITAPEPGQTLDAHMAVSQAPRKPMRLVGTVAVSAEVVPPPDGCVAAIATRIRLKATHMGQVEGDGQTCIQSLTPDADPPFLPPGPPPYGTAPFVPTWVLEAANGDLLRLEGFESVAVLGLETRSLRARGNFRILGGTGRFAGATGELQASSVNYFGQPADEFRATGWIEY